MLYKRIITVFLSLVIGFSTIPAVGAVDYTNKDTFWNWVSGSGGIVQDIVGLACGSACPSSDDGHHHAKSYLKGTKDGVYRCICTYCGSAFNAYASDLNDAYTKHVKSLPARGYGSDGSLYVSPNHSQSKVNITNNRRWYYCSHSNETPKLTSSVGTLTCGNPVKFRSASSSGTSYFWHLDTVYEFTCTVDGLYSWGAYSASCSGVTSSGSTAVGSASTYHFQ